MQPSLRGGTIGVFICKNSQWKIFQKLNKQNCHVCSSSLFLKAHSNKASNFHTRRSGSSISQSKFTHLISKPCSLFPFCLQGHSSSYFPILHCISPCRKEERGNDKRCWYSKYTSLYQFTSKAIFRYACMHRSKSCYYFL